MCAIQQTRYQYWSEEHNELKWNSKCYYFKLNKIDDNVYNDKIKNKWNDQKARIYFELSAKYYK